jgi:hypothetical protein
MSLFIRLNNNKEDGRAACIIGLQTEASCCGFEIKYLRKFEVRCAEMVCEL